MRVVAIIPARMAATRFPGKPLADLLGLPMIEHVRRRVALSSLLHDVIVATCDEEIARVVKQSGGKAVMTSHTHERCTDRIAEAALSIQAEVIINIQGDEPLVRPEMFEGLLRSLTKEPELPCANLMAEILDDSEFNNHNVVKTVFDLDANALYFSREPIPSRSKAGELEFKKFKQLGVIAFRSDFLQTFNRLPPTPLEQVESVDMMRAIEHGYRVRMVQCEHRVIGVDTPEDLARASKLMEMDDLLPRYLR